MIVPVPPSRPGRRFQPVPLLAKGVAHFLRCAVCTGCVVKVKDTPELKTIYDYKRRLELLTGAYRVATERTTGLDILVIDDLYRSGATMQAVATALYESGKANSVYVLAITRTRSKR